MPLARGVKQYSASTSVTRSKTLRDLSTPPPGSARRIVRVCHRFSHRFITSLLSPLLFTLSHVPSLSLPLFFIKPPCAICSRLRRHEKRQPVVTLRYYVAARKPRGDKRSPLVRLSLSPFARVRYLSRVRARAGVREGAFLLSQTRTRTRYLLVYARRLYVPRQYGRSYVMREWRGARRTALDEGVARTPL